MTAYGAQDSLSTSSLRQRDLSLLIAQVVNHYDTALYGLLAPLLGPLFFPNHAPVAQLFLTYGVIATGMLTRPLGTYVFGWLSVRKTPDFSIKISLAGVSASMLLFATLPTHQTIGVLAPLGMVSARMVLDFFVTGMRGLGGVMLLSNKNNRASFFWASLYGSADILGPLLASGAVMMVTLLIPFFPEVWRFAFLIGALLCGLILLLPSHTLPLQTQDLSLGKKTRVLHREALRQWRTLGVIALCSSFSYMTYAVPFVFMNSYVPLVTGISLAQMTANNMVFLSFDMALPLVLSPLLSRYQPANIMLCSASLLAVTGGPLICFLKNASLPYILSVRFWFVFWGVLFGIAQAVWVSRLFQGPARYALPGIGSVLGSSLLGRNTTLILLFCIQAFGHPWGAGGYICLLSALTALALVGQRKVT